MNKAMGNDANMAEKSVWAISSYQADTGKVRQIQMLLLQEMLRVCKENGLAIWVCGGTLLGTVREHGYIPWDDDIDLFMLRMDYDKLVRIGAEVFKTPFFFQNSYSDNYYHRGHAQLRYQGTTAILPLEINCKFDQSIFIDVFVFDKLPADERILQRRSRKIKCYHNLLRIRATLNFEPRKVLRSTAYLFARSFFFFVSFRWFFSKFENLCRSMSANPSTIYSCPAFSVNLVERNKIEEEWLKKTIYMPFEDIIVPVPVGYDMILQNAYGKDYMTPRKEPNMHGEVIFDTERSYVEVLKDIKSGKIRTKL